MWRLKRGLVKNSSEQCGHRYEGPLRLQSVAESSENPGYRKTRLLQGIHHQSADMVLDVLVLSCASLETFVNLLLYLHTHKTIMNSNCGVF